MRQQTSILAWIQGLQLKEPAVIKVVGSNLVLEGEFGLERMSGFLVLWATLIDNDYSKACFATNLKGIDTFACLRVPTYLGRYATC